MGLHEVAIDAKLFPATDGSRIIEGWNRVKETNIVTNTYSFFQGLVFRLILHANIGAERD